MVEIDLSHISADGIIYNRDEASAKTLLELIIQLIEILNNEEEDANSQLINDEDLRVDSELLDQYNH